MKQHQMTHKFRDNPGGSDANYNLSLPSSPHLPPPPRLPSTPLPEHHPKSPESSPLTSPPTSEAPLSPPFTGVKRASQEEVGVSLVDRPPEKRAILCG